MNKPIGRILLMLLVSTQMAMAQNKETGLVMNTDQAILEAAHDKVLDITEALTLEAWIKVADIPNREMRIIDKYHNNVSGFDVPGGGYALGIDKNNKIWMTAGRSSIISKDDLPLHRWIHIAGVFSVPRGILKLYIDGKEIASNGKAGMMKMLITHIPIRIGADWEEKLRFTGAIMRVAIYNRALHEADIRSLATDRSMVSKNSISRVADWFFGSENWNKGNRVKLEFMPEITGPKEWRGDNLALWYAKPAKTWTEALPVGNGRLGAMIFGKPGHERIQLNDITIWSGKPERGADRPGAYKALPAIRKALKEGNYTEAQKLTRQYISTNNPEGGNIYNSIYFASYQTLGDLNFDFTLDKGEISAYRRWLDIDKAIAGVDFKAGATTYSREIFSSAPAGAIIIRVKGSRKGSVNFSMNLSRLVSATTAFEAPNTLVMKGNTDLYGRKGNVDYESRVRLLAPSGKVSGKGDQLTVKNADEAVIIINCGTSYILDFDKNYKTVISQADLLQILQSASTNSYDNLKAQHINDYQQYFHRVTLDLGNSETARLPTDLRLEQYGDGEKDKAMVSLFYQYGRYLMISSSRANNPLPSNSQGIWGDGLKLPWHADYKSNINYQMNYWGVESSNLSEMHLPMLHLNTGLVKPGRNTAKAYFNAPGWVMAMMTNPWGWTSPGESPGWGSFFGGGGWVCQHLWEHYAFTRDKKYLESVYPVLKEACIFYLASMIPDKNGLLVTSPSTSPENTYTTPSGFRGNVVEGGAMEREIIWDLYSNTIQAAIVLQLDDDFRQQLESARAQIRPLQVGKAGQLMEWGEDWDMEAPEIHHRHVSHLFALHPGHQVSPANTPILAAAARKSLEIRGDDGTGWSLAWKINFWARLLDGDHALTLINKQLRYVNTSVTNMTNGGGTYANLFDAHPPFQIDGNFGFISGVNEMLLQSQENYQDPAAPGADLYIINLLPALPGKWSTGIVKGLRARGGYELEITWDHGKLTSVIIKNIAGSGAKLRYGGKTIDVNLGVGKTLQLDGNLQ